MTCKICIKFAFNESKKKDDQIFNWVFMYTLLLSIVNGLNINCIIH